MVKKAVDRNLYKRQIREMLIQHLKKNQSNCQINNEHEHHNLVIIIRQPYLEKDYQENQNNLYKLLNSNYKKAIPSSFFQKKKPCLKKK